MVTNVVDLFDYCIIAREGTPIAGKLTWDDVGDLLDLLDMQASELDVSGGYSGRTQVVTLPHLHDDEIQIAVMWGKVRRLANDYRMDGGPVMSKPLQDQLLIRDPSADVIVDALREFVNNMNFRTNPPTVA